MDSSLFLTVIQDILILILQLSAPILVVAVAVGLVISIFQSVTQIQEQTLTFVPKIFLRPAADQASTYSAIVDDGVIGKIPANSVKA